MSDKARNAGQFKVLPVADIVRAPWNPRRTYEPAEFEALEASILSAGGILVPVTVRPIEGGKYELIAGERRTAVARKLQMPTIPALVRRLSDVEAMEVALIDNNQRADVPALDEAVAFAALAKMDASYTPAVIAAKIGRSESYVYRRLMLLNLVDDARRFLYANAITVAHAERLARLTPALQAEALTTAGVVFDAAGLLGDRLLPVRELDRFVRARTVVDVAAADARAVFPELVAALEAEAIDASTILPLSMAAAADVKAAAGGRLTGQAPVPVSRWVEVKGPKACKHAQRGVVVHGGPERLLWACATRGCPKHFPAAAPAPKRSETAELEDGGHDGAVARPSSAKLTAAEREAQNRKLFDRALPELRRRFRAHVGVPKMGAALVRSLVSKMAIEDTRQAYGIELTDRTAVLFLVLSSASSPYEFAVVQSMAAWGFKAERELARIKRELEAPAASVPAGRGKRR